MRVYITREVMQAAQKKIDYCNAAFRNPGSGETKITRLNMLGDARYHMYQLTQNPEHLKLAKNCYLAARHYLREQNLRSW